MYMPKLMSIVNCTPDSFFDGGKHNEPSAAFEYAIMQLDAGASILDVGGESTRPNFTPILAEEELRRVIPVIEMLHKEQSRRAFSISIDTTKAEVAKAALNAGANIVNDVSAMEHDPAMLDVIAESKATAVLQHTGKYANRQGESGTTAISVLTYLKNRADLLLERGFSKGDIYIDPGIGFGKTQEENLSLIANIGELVETGFPVLLGVSRKSYIGKIDGLEKSDRLIPSVVSGLWAAQQGVKVLRIHDTKEMQEGLLTIGALWGAIGEQSEQVPRHHKKIAVGGILL
ncbi:dihydropteroate synthase [Fibrobacterales bacterium]|nr:dihydropteroate synthase [Fibrobacterales bacterium]